MSVYDGVARIIAGALVRYKFQSVLVQVHNQGSVLACSASNVARIFCLVFHQSAMGMLSDEINSAAAFPEEKYKFSASILAIISLPDGFRLACSGRQKLITGMLAARQIKSVVPR